MRKLRLGSVRLLITIVAATLPRIAAGQASAADPVHAAVELRDAGDLAGAARLLRSRLTEQPNDASVIRLLAQTLYWLKQFDDARSLYDTALRRHPNNVEIRLEYARMLTEIGDGRGARYLLTPLSDLPATAARANTLIGTLDYWEGRLTGATRHFRAALRADSTSSEARRQWREIATITAPWIRIGFEAAHDDQPLNRLSPSLNAGVFLTPLWSLEAAARRDWYGSGDSLSRTVPTGEISFRGYTPALRLDTEFSGGILQRSFGASSGDWTAGLQARFRVPGHFTIGGRAERKPYFYTTASLTIPVMVREFTALAGLNDPAGWVGEAGVGRVRYPDGNAVTSGYAWLLAPVMRSRTTGLSLGYAFSAQDARESRFVLANPSQPAQPGTPAFDLAGRYVPYYTPNQVIAHSAIGSLTLRPGSGVSISGNGSWAINAYERAPEFVVSGAPPSVQVDTVRRRFTPWTARLVIAQDVESGWSVRAQFEHNRTAFYATSAAAITMIYRFSAASARRVDRF